MPENIFLKLSKKAYVPVDFPVARVELEEAISSFFNFLNLPNDIKNHINLKIAPRHRRGDIGYQHRDPNDDIYNDSKEFFHFHPLIIEKYGDFLSAHPMVKDFMTKALRIWHVVYDVTLRQLQELDKVFPNTSDKVFASDEPHILLRFLRYDWQKSGAYLAKPHFDSGSFTLAIAESGPGLRIGKRPEDLEIIQHSEKQAIFMLSSNFKKLIDANNLFAGWHDVIQLDDSKIGKPFARWAIVAFIEGSDVEALPRSLTHSWHLPQSREESGLSAIG